MKDVRLLVISLPCYQPVNRAVYRELAEKQGVKLHLVVPQKLLVGGHWRTTPSAEEPAPYELTQLALVGTQGRLQTLRGLAAVAAAWQPTHVLVDNDPASLLVWQAARACPAAQIWAMTAENLQPHLGQALWAGLRALRPAQCAAPLLKFVLRRVVHPRVHRVFTLSRAGTAVMESLGFAGRTTQIPLGFDPALFQIQRPAHIAATRTALGLNQPTIAYFGRLTPEKGVHLLVDALAQLQTLPWQLLIDRFADYQTAYTATLGTKIATLGLADRVVYFDAQHHQMPNFMNAADIVVLPSISTPKWQEQYGRVLPEAMACGKRVIGSNSGAIPELVADRGVIVPEGDVAALRDAIQALLLAGDFSAQAELTSAYAHAHLSIRRQAAIWAGLLVS